MGYIPESAKWYLADLVVHIRVEADPRRVVHTNTMLVRADSPEEAYAKAIHLGKNEETSYENPEGKLVTFTFRGLRNLSAIHDKLEHGAELSFSERIGMDEGAIAECVSAKEDLAVFAPETFKRREVPDYSAGEIIEKLYEEFPSLRPTGNRKKPN